MEEVTSEKGIELAMGLPERYGRGRTGVKGVGDGVEHVGVHVRVDRPVRGGVVACSDKDRVPLGDSDRDEVDRRFLNVRLRKGGRVISSRTPTDQVSVWNGRGRTPSTSMMRMSCPSIQKKNAAKAEVLMTLSR